MSIFKRQKKSMGQFYNQLVSLWTGAGGLSSGVNYKKMIEAYRGWVYACASKNASAVASGELVLYQKKPESSKPKFYLKTGRGSIKVSENTYEAARHNPEIVRYVRKGWELEEITDHPFLELMDQVNPFRNGWDLLFETDLFQELTGNAYWYAVPSRLTSAIPGRKLPAELWTLQSDKVKILPSERDFIRGYEYQMGEKKTVFDPSEIVHFRFPNPEDQFYGLAPLQAAAYAADIEEKKKRYILNFFQNFAIPPVVMKADYDAKTAKGPSWTREEWDDYRKNFTRMHGGPDNAGKMALLQGGLDIKTVGFSPKEFFHLVNNRPTIEELAAIYGIPLFKLTGEGTDALNAEKSDYSYMKDTITPRLRQIEQKINEQLMPLYGKGLFVAFSSVVPEDKDFELEEHKTLVNTVMTVNEIRSRRGLEPVDNGDQLYIENRQVPLGYEFPTEVTTEDATEVTQNMIDGLTEILSKQLAPIPPETYQQRIARKYEKEVAAIIDGLIRRFHDDIDKRLKSGNQDIEYILGGLPEIMEISRSKAKILERPYEEAGKRAVREVSEMARRRSKAPIGVSFSLTSAHALEQMQLLRSGFSVYFDHQHRNVQGVRDTLSASMDAGDAADITSWKVAAEMGLSEKYTTALGDTAYRMKPGNSYKALRIARTECIRASNWGALEGWIQTGLVKGKEWSAAHDACDFCADLDGQTWEVQEDIFRQGDVFTLGDGQSMEFGYSDIPACPLHPSCRCALLPILF